MESKVEIDDGIFDILLYVSRLDATASEYLSLKSQIGSIVDSFKELEKFKGEDDISGSFYGPNSEDDLRSDGIDASYVDQHSLKLINCEFMDGYFRTPKVLASS